MFDANSRYAGKPVATWTDAQGRGRTYVVLREVPMPPPPSPADRTYVVRERDRLDRIAWELLGDPERFWMLCDANRATDPLALTQIIGRRLRVPWGGGIG